MRLALTHAYCWPEVQRGGERTLHELARALDARDHQVTVLTSSWKAMPPTFGRVRVVRLRRLRTTAPRHEADFGRRILPHLLAGRYDAVHSLGPRDAVASIRAAHFHPRRRTVYTNLGLPARWWWEQQPDAAAHRQVVRRIDVYGCTSRFGLETLATDYGRRGVLTPGGVSLDDFRPAPRRTEDPTLFYSGALDEPRKGVALLLQAVAILAQSEPDIRLWLSGTGDTGPLLAAAPAAARSRTVVLPPGPDAQGKRYGQAWATVLPSTNEAFGLVLIESLASGTPVVGTDHSAIPELVTPETGALCEPGDAGSLAEACRRALVLARQPGIADRCRAAAAPFDWESALAPRFERYYAGD